MISVVMLSVIILSVVMLGVMASIDRRMHFSYFRQEFVSENSADDNYQSGYASTFVKYNILNITYRAWLPWTISQWGL